MWKLKNQKKKTTSETMLPEPSTIDILKSITRDEIKKYLKSCTTLEISDLANKETEFEPLLLECSNKFKQCAELFQKWYLTRQNYDFNVFNKCLDEFFSFFQTKKLGIFIEEEYKYLRVLPDTNLDIVYMKRRFLESGILGIYCSFEYNPTMDIHLLTLISNSGEPYIIN